MHQDSRTSMTLTETLSSQSTENQAATISRITAGIRGQIGEAVAMATRSTFASSGGGTGACPKAESNPYQTILLAGTPKPEPPSFGDSGITWLYLGRFPTWIFPLCWPGAPTGLRASTSAWLPEGGTPACCNFREHLLQQKRPKGADIQVSLPHGPFQT